MKETKSLSSCQQNHLNVLTHEASGPVRPEQGYMWTPSSPPPSATVSMIFFMTSACLKQNKDLSRAGPGQTGPNLARSYGSEPELRPRVPPAGVYGAHGWWGEVGVVLDGDGLLHVVLTDVLVHLVHGQGLSVLRNKARSS